VERLAHRLCELRPNSALERPLVLRAQWLSWRAQRAATAASVAADPAPVEEARAFLTRAVQEREPRNCGARIEALRVLALAGDWDLIDAALRHNPLHPTSFETVLGLGDLALGRARAALGLPAVDDDYGEPVTGISQVAPDSDRVAAAFGEAEQGYREAGRFAEEQDQRLETGWYGDTVHQRLALLELNTSRARRET
jgi:hypothetical protein